jgi:hypothetical protein
MKNITEKEIFTFKLVSGEEIVAKVISVQNSELIELTHPVSIAPTGQGLSLIPSMFTSERDKSVTLNTNTVTMYCETDDAIKMKYIEATTGIATSSKKIVLG